MKGGKISFKGQATSAAEERAKRTSGYGYLNLPRGLGVFAPIPGKSVTLDFFPYVITSKNHPDKDDKSGRATKGSYWYKRPFKIHRNVGAENDTVVCLSTFGKPCPICEYKIKRVKEGADKDEVKSLKPGERNLYVVNPLDSDKHEKGSLYVFDISEYLFQEFLDAEIKDADGVPDDFFDPEEGVSLKVRFKASTMGNSKPFADADKITVVDRAKQYKPAFYDTAPDLDGMLTVLTYDELWAKFFEVDKEESDDDEDETPRTKKSVKKKVADDDDDDDDDVLPVRKKKEDTLLAKSKKQTPDDDDDDDEKLTWKDLTNLNTKQLIKYIKANDLIIDADDFEDDDNGLREAIAKELDIKVPGKKPAPAPIAKKNRCPACNGTGKNSKGNICKICMGTGVKQKEEEDVDDEEDDEPIPPVKKKKTISLPDDECPSDHVFGKDVDRFDECDECPLWDNCMAAKNAKKKK
jgi:hypothetical protein